MNNGSKLTFPALGDLYDAAAFSITLTFGAFEAPFGSGKSRANREYSTSMLRMKGDANACLAASGSSSSKACKSISSVCTS